MNAEHIQTVTVASLGDLTGHQSHQNRTLPKIWVDTLKNLFPDLEVSTELPKPKKDQLAALIPKTTLVIKVKPFVWALIKTVANSWLLLEQYPGQNAAGQTVRSIAVLEALQDMVNSFVKLNENHGEMCTYTALVKSSDPIQRALMFRYPTRQELINTHQVLREKCQITTCVHYQENCCQISEQNLLKIIDELLHRGVFEHYDEETLWVTL